MKKIVLLDIDDTILDFKACERNAIQKTMEKYGVKPNNELVEKYSKIPACTFEKQLISCELLVSTAYTGSPFSSKPFTDGKGAVKMVSRI